MVNYAENPRKQQQQQQQTTRKTNIQKSIAFLHISNKII